MALDHIIVGAASTGSVPSDRLSADGRTRVSVLEAAASDKGLFVRMPKGFDLLPDAGGEQARAVFAAGDASVPPEYRWHCRMRGGSGPIRLRGQPDDHDGRERARRAADHPADTAAGLGVTNLDRTPHISWE